MALAVLARAGLLHAGSGLELTVIEHDWSQDGSVFRVAAIGLSDELTCFDFDRATCSAPTLYALGEIGFQYRWASASARAISLGVSVQLGARRLKEGQGARTSIVYGVLGPRLQAEF